MLKLAIASLALLLPGISAADDFVYFSEAPRMCSMEATAYNGQQFAVFVVTDSDLAVEGVRFRLDTDRFDAEDVQSVTPADGVSIVEGNIFDGIELTVGARGLVHEPVLYVTLSGHNDVGYVWTRDVEVDCCGGEKSLPDQITVAYPSDCLTEVPQWTLPDVVEVTIGFVNDVTFRAGLKTASVPGDAVVEVSDAAGWAATPDPFDVEAVCSWCPWSGTDVTVPVDVPSSVVNGTESTAVIEMYSFGNLVESKTITLRAVTAVDAEPTTWGKMKALYD